MTFHRVRILPLLVLVAFLALTVRAGEFVTGVKTGISARAQQEVETAPPPLTLAQVGDDTADALPYPVEGNTDDEPTAWRDASETEFYYSPIRQELYEDLSRRRQEIEEKERALVTREALLTAAERELDQKLRELTAVRNEIRSLLDQQSEEENERITSLVRIYEGMKAKDAARIFNTLDMDVLIAVMSRMSERRSSPILAEMTPDRARAVTILLAQQKQLPTIPQ